MKPESLRQNLRGDQQKKTAAAELNVTQYAIWQVKVKKQMLNF